MSNLDQDSNFEQWYRSAHRRVLAAMITYCGDLARAQDATDHAFSTVVASWPDVLDKDCPVAWTFTLARNALRHQWRRKTRERHLLEQGNVLGASIQPDHAGAVAAALELSAVLSCLTTKQRTVVIAHLGFGVPQQDVAALLGVSRSTVATTLFDARKRIRRYTADSRETTSSEPYTPSDRSLR
jgi:RNA polymerase sigma factor (sigma-70 family)